MAPSTTPSTGRPDTGQRLEVSITAVGAQARGIAHADGFTLLVPRGLPEERVEVEVNAVHSRFAEARLTAVREPSAGRVEPVCGDFEACGGCDWQHVSYERQLVFKKQVAEDQLERIGKTRAPSDWSIVPSPEQLAYRNKLEFVTCRQGDLALPGFHGARDGKPVPVAQCRLAPAAYTQVAALALELLTREPFAGRGVARAVTRLTVQGNDDRGRGRGMALTLHCNDRGAAAALQEGAPAYLAELESAFPNLRVVALSVRPREGKSNRARQIMLKGRDVLFKTVGPERHAVPLDGFFQANLPQAAQLVARVKEIVTGAVAQPPDVAAQPPEDSAQPPKESAQPPGDATRPLVMDLFCGAGLYALPLAAAGCRVVGVELRPEVVRAAAKMADKRGLTEARFRAADLGKAGILEGLTGKHGMPACVVVNPPRAGLPRRLTEALLRLAPPLLVYVSCDGGTFARDTARLAPRYELADLQGFDMFPQTHHLELLATFRLRPE